MGLFSKLKKLFTRKDYQPLNGFTSEQQRIDYIHKLESKRPEYIRRLSIINQNLERVYDYQTENPDNIFQTKAKLEQTVHHYLDQRDIPKSVDRQLEPRPYSNVYNRQPVRSSLPDRQQVAYSN